MDVAEWLIDLALGLNMKIIVLKVRSMSRVMVIGNPPQTLRHKLQIIFVYLE